MIYKDGEKAEDMCPECHNPWNSEYHISDECVNLDEDSDYFREEQWR